MEGRSLQAGRIVNTMNKLHIKKQAYKMKANFCNFKHCEQMIIFLVCNLLFNI